MMQSSEEIFGDSCGSSATTLSKRKSQEERDNDVEDQLFVNKKHSKKSRKRGKLQKTKKKSFLISLFSVRLLLLFSWI